MLVDALRCRATSAAVNRVCLSLLLYLMIDVDNAADACAVGALPLVVSALSSVAHASQAFRALDSVILVVGTSLQVQALECGVMEALIAIVAARGGDAEDQLLAFKALAVLLDTDSQDARAARAVRAARAGAKPVMEAFLRKHGSLIAADIRVLILQNLPKVWALAAAGADAAAAALLEELESEPQAQQAAPARGSKKKKQSAKRRGGRAGGASGASGADSEPAAAVASSDDEAKSGDGAGGFTAEEQASRAVADASAAEVAPPPQPVLLAVLPPPPLPPAALPPSRPPVTTAWPGAAAASALPAWAPAPAVLPPLPAWLQQARSAAAAPASSCAVAVPPAPPPPPAAPAPAAPSLEEQLLALLREKEAEREARLCIICLDAPKDTILQPCSHLCVCGGCAAALKARADGGLCPVCRAAVASHAHVFL